MKRVFSEENRLQCLLDVEAALARAHATLGNIPTDAAQVISDNANTSTVTVQRVEQIENEIRHDIMALVKAMSEQCGESGKYIHLGATSNDIIDTANGLQLMAASEIIRASLAGLRDSLLEKAKKHRDTVMVGRTHGQFAVPLTFGLKMAVYALEFQRHIERLSQGRERFCVGKMLGAVGTGASLDGKALQIQDIVMKDLGLFKVEACTQLVGRDRYIELIGLMANISTTVEKVGTEIRNLQRPEIMEAAEAFDAAKQVGSSTMAHKRNPITSENVCGLARIVRGFLLPTMENNILWHERDLCNSSAERFTLAHSLVLADDILVKLAGVIDNLAVYPDNMRRNLLASGGLIMAEPVMMVLTKFGMGRQEAHELVRSCSMKVSAGKSDFRQALLDEPGISELLNPDQLDAALDPDNYLGLSTQLVDDAVEKYLGK